MTLEVGFLAKNPGCERRVMELELRSYLKQPSSIDRALISLLLAAANVRRNTALSVMYLMSAVFSGS